MLKRWPLLLMVLVIPVLTFLTVLAVEWKLNGDLTQAAIESLKISPAQANELTLERLCEIDEPAFAEVCGTYHRLRLLRNVSVWSGAAGLFLYFGIALAGFVAQKSRTLLWLLFRTGLYLSISTVCILIVVDAFLIIGAVYYSESVFLGRVHFILIGAIGLGAIVGAFSVLSASFDVVRKASTTVVGTVLDDVAAPDLWELVRKTAAKIGALPPEEIVVGLDPNFFVTEARVVCLDGALDARTLFVSLPLCRVMSVDELQAIIGHELAHFKGEDTRFSERFYPIYRGAADACEALDVEEDSGVGAFARLPGVAILLHFIASFTIAETKISREREIAADLEGARATSVLTVAAALVKVHAYVPVWSLIQKRILDASRRGSVLSNLSAYFAVAAGVCREDPSFLDGLDATHTEHPTDSHPPLGIRLQALGVSLKEIPHKVLLSDPASPASALLLNLEALESRLGDEYQRSFAKSAGVALPRNAPHTSGEPFSSQEPLIPTEENCDAPIADERMLSALILSRLGDEKPPFDLPCPFEKRPAKVRKYLETTVSLYQLRLFVDTVSDTYGNDFAKVVNDSIKGMLPSSLLPIYETEDRRSSSDEEPGEPNRELETCIEWLMFFKQADREPSAGPADEEQTRVLWKAALSEPDCILGVRWLLAARQRAATLHRVVMRSCALDPKFSKAVEGLRWKSRPGCFEGRLKSRFENPLSEEAAREITQTEILALRARDAFDAWIFDKECREFIEAFGARPDLSAVTVAAVIDVIQSLDRLLARGLELGGALENQLDLLEEFRGNLLRGIPVSESPTEAGPREYIAGLVGLKKRLAFFSRCTREDAPMEDAELPMALLQEDPETIDTTLKAIDEADTGTGFSAMLCRECLALLKSAEQKGIRIPRAEEKRAVLESAG